MLTGYLNYPNSRVTAHTNQYCGKIRSQNKVNQRRVTINSQNLQAELQNFRNGHYRFAAEPAFNDLYVLIDLSNTGNELQTLNLIHQSLGQIYDRFRKATLKICC